MFKTTCIQCGSGTNNPRFCSRSCAARHNNKKFPKRRMTRKCGLCEKPVLSTRRFCKACRSLKTDITLAHAIYSRHHKSSAFALVRLRARAVAHQLGIDKACQLCGYSKHVEVAHRKAISTFPENALLSEINRPSNLMCLCPNCHWEVDRGITEAPEGIAPSHSELEAPMPAYRRGQNRQHPLKELNFPSGFRRPSARAAGEGRRQ